MKAQTIQVEEETTIEDLLKQKGLDPNMYFVSVNGTMAKQTTKVTSSDKIKVYPSIAGG